MNLKAVVHRRPDNGDDLRMTPIMNVFLIIVPFLLLTASFVKIAILEMSLPSLSGHDSAPRAAPASEQPKQLVLNTLAIRSNGFELKSPTFNFPFINKRGEQYDFEQLQAHLRQIKNKFPDSEDVVIQPEDVIKYDIMIKVMDRCRESGFPNISISG
ncbi:MAG: biopolymer transporter ExbD [candidate division KSB1 bacterium]|nr:biopolymer transporter ExbD [candidate division KSB1 bacterium]MDZ7302051.1 biopolymer transporter ExbD [candidate division KSB1 bacterium]MDZ7311093.1 biopolymer transporter ExbD [candidate division KSB1 bacterium]